MSKGENRVPDCRCHCVFAVDNDVNNASVNAPLNFGTFVSTKESQGSDFTLMPVFWKFKQPVIKLLVFDF